MKKLLWVGLYKVTISAIPDVAECVGDPEDEAGLLLSPHMVLFWPRAGCLLVVDGNWSIDLFWDMSQASMVHG